jgi:hypothetical protein
MRLILNLGWSAANSSAPRAQLAGEQVADHEGVPGLCGCGANEADHAPAGVGVFDDAHHEAGHSLPGRVWIAVEDGRRRLGGVEQ